MNSSSKPNRSLLFVPGDDERKLDRALHSRADIIILDLEDAVAPNRKEHARAEVSSRIRSGAFGSANVAVRINPRGSGDFEEDLAVVVPAWPNLLMIPKVEGLHDVEHVARVVAKHEVPGSPLHLLALVETARGIERLGSFSDPPASPDSGIERLAGLCFGNADFALDMGLPDADLANGVLAQARSRLAIAAVAARVPPIDGVCLAVKDDDAFAAQARAAVGLGFEGKLCIHPAQVGLANEIFTPDANRTEASQRILDAWESSAGDDRGVITLDGQMVDAPLVEVHRRVLERARVARIADES